MEPLSPVVLAKLKRLEVLESESSDLKSENKLLRARLGLDDPLMEEATTPYQETRSFLATDSPDTDNETASTSTPARPPPAYLSYSNSSRRLSLSGKALEEEQKNQQAQRKRMNFGQDGKKKNVL